MPSSQVLEAIAVTAELCGKSFSGAAAMMFASDLEGFSDEQILVALTRCRKELKGSLSVSDVISRIDDGRPGVEQAWAMLPYDEDSSTVWTDEMSAAWGLALPLLQEGDKIAARMAFKEAYVKAVSDARDSRKPPKWTASFGRDVAARQMAITEAVRLKRLSLDAGINLLPADQAEAMVMSLGISNHPLLAAPSTEGKKKVGELLKLLDNKKV